MNIGIIHGFVGGGGGTEKTLKAIIDALETTEHNVTLYTFSKPNLNLKKIKIKSFLPISIPSFGLYQRAMEPKLVAKAKNEDLLIQTSGGLCIPKKSNQKIIVYCHSDFTNEIENPATKYKGMWSLYYKPYYNMIKKFFENIQDSRIHLISNSQYIHDIIQKKFGKNSIIINPPIDLTEFSINEKKNRVVTVGRFSEEKNLEFGINVMKNIDFEYNIIGNTNTKSNILYYEKLEYRIRKEKLNKINLLKNLERKKLVDIVNTTRVYFHCSRETFGISVVEGISAGCIPIVPDIAGHKETVPFSELRYKENDLEHAREKITYAFEGKFDDLLPSLQNSINKYSHTQFGSKIIEYVESVKL